MPTKPGEYCMRCGTKCEITNSVDLTQSIWTCPKGHGIQRIEGNPAPLTETGILALDINDPTHDVVALEDASTTADVGSGIRIDSEEMTVTDVSDPSNLRVTRGAVDGYIEDHAAGATVNIYGKPAKKAVQQSVSKKK